MGLPTPAAQAESTLAKALEGRRLQFPSPSGTAQPHLLTLFCSAQMQKGSGLSIGLPSMVPQAEDSSAEALKRRRLQSASPADTALYHHLDCLLLSANAEEERSANQPADSGASG